ncbi:MAG TPA: hypothetical protein VGF57_04210, partial [Roseiarcus sp.]
SQPLAKFFQLPSIGFSDSILFNDLRPPSSSPVGAWSARPRSAQRVKLPHNSDFRKQKIRR